MWTLSLLLGCVEPTPPDVVTPPPVPTPKPEPTEPTGPTDPSEPLTIRDVGFRLHDDFGSLAYVGWTQSRRATLRVEVSVDGAWQSAPERTYDAGESEQIVLGVPYDTDADFRIAFGDEVLAEGTLRTGPVPPILPLPTLKIANPGGWSGDRYLLTSVSDQTGGWVGRRFWTVILDRAGRPVWARRSDDWTLYAQVSASTGAELLIDEDTAYNDGDHGAASRILRVRLDGPVSEVAAPGLEHPFVELPDGTLAWGSRVHDPTEALVELAPGASDPVIRWTCADDWPGSGDCDSNSLAYDAASDSYVYSFWTNDAVVAIDRATGETQWWAGGVGGGLSFDPADSVFWLQHGLSITGGGTLLLSTEAAGPTTMVREYEIGASALREVWSADAGVYARYNGDAARLPNGNTLHVVGSAGLINELASDGTVVWQLDWDADRLLGEGVLLDDLYALAGP